MPSAEVTPAAVISRRSTCRLCDAADVELVLPLTPTPPADAYVPYARLDVQQDAYPLDLYLCRSCGHAQLLDVVNPDILFGEYIYVTTSSPGLVAHFRDYAERVFERAGRPTGALAVDVGSNDGTLLRFLRDKGMRVLGVDAAAEIARQATADGIETIPGFFTSELARQIRKDRGPAALATANNVFAHADGLGDIADGIRTLLARDGIFVFEVSYLLDLVQGMVFDYIYHEHLCYHSVKPLQTFLHRHGLELIDAERIATKGGSLRCVAQLAGGPRQVAAAVEELITLEEAVGLQRPKTFMTFAAEIDGVKERLFALLTNLRAQDKRAAGYGASATVTTLLYHFELAGLLDFIVDDNVTRQGLFSPGLHIPVRTPRALYEEKPNIVVVLAWRFADLILEQHEAFLAQGGQFIVPLPSLRVV